MPCQTYVAIDEMGRPVHPEWYSDEFHWVSDRAGRDALAAIYRAEDAR